MKLYYSTYGLQQLNVFEALPRLKDMGYEGIEINVSPGWPTEPTAMDQATRRKVADLLRHLDWPTPAFMASLSPGTEGEERSAVLAQTHATFEMSREFRLDDNPMVICTTLGRHPSWDAGKERIVELVLEVADIAAEYDVIVAIEPHAGDDFETPEKAAWLMEQTGHPNLGLNFDYSHFVVEGIDLQHSIDLNLKYSFHNHIKDGYLDEEGRVCYQLPGAGALDLNMYFKAMQDAGWDTYICPEVTGQIWNAEGYDAWGTAQFCYDALSKARALLCQS